MRPLFGDEDALGLFPSPPTDKVSKTGPKTPPDRLLINCNCIKRSPTMRFVKFLQPGDRIFFDVHWSSAFSKTLLAPIKLQWSPRKRCHFVLLTTLHLGKWSSGEPTKSSTPYPNYTGKGLSYYQKKYQNCLLQNSQQLVPTRARCNRFCRLLATSVAQDITNLQSTTKIFALLQLQKFATSRPAYCARQTLEVYNRLPWLVFLMPFQWVHS